MRSSSRHPSPGWLNYYQVAAQVTWRRKCVDYIERLQVLCPIRATEREQISHKLSTWRWRQAVPPKYHNKLIILHGVTTQQTTIWATPAAEAWKLTIKYRYSQWKSLTSRKCTEEPPMSGVRLEGSNTYNYPRQSVVSGSRTSIIILTLSLILMTFVLKKSTCKVIASVESSTNDRETWFGG